MALDDARVTESLKSLSGWERRGNEITKTYNFKNYYETMAFVNAVAWIAHGQDHHPDMEVGYNKCRVKYTTHDAGGISEKDFAGARKVESLLGRP